MQCDVDIGGILGGDSQHNPDDIPKVVKPLLLDEADSSTEAASEMVKA
jgi:hypothetical protein